MHHDVVDLRDFYYRRALGRKVQQALRRQVATLWPDVRGLSVVGYGFAVPLLRPFLADARRVTALMPGPQGVMYWPPALPNVSVLCAETRWPLETGHVDRLIILHGFETCERQAALLDEVYRVLGPGGRALFVVPNRAGLWARRDSTPFAMGRPYTLGQLTHQLHAEGLRPERSGTALFFPPSHRKFWLRSSGVLEKTGGRMANVLSGGVLLQEVSKQVPRPVGPAAASRAPRMLEVLDGAARPV